MLEDKRLSKCDYWVGIEVGDRFNSTLLSIATREVGRSDDDVFTNLPVKSFSISVVECD